MITVAFTREEAHALLAFLDAGVKALGRPAAKACAILDDKVQAALLRESSAAGNEAAPNGSAAGSRDPAG
jgi:hypothetical protein